MSTDPDLDWLHRHHPRDQAPRLRAALARKVANTLLQRARDGDVPCTIGVFGGWGSGKTTFLALLARELDSRVAQVLRTRVVYFNAWKYAGLMEIVPSLIYKILVHGTDVESERKRNEAASRVLLSLGKEYADKFGAWAERRVGVDPVRLFKEVHHLGATVTENHAAVDPKLVQAYYSQIDRAQDALADALGSVPPGGKPDHLTVVLVDELDRCDPDEAFAVIKQLRVLFAMRRLPIVFVICANPEPIGQAIKHRYGLHSENGDYESRRILEKFVDAYEDFAEPVALGDIVRALWSGPLAEHLPWIVRIDEANGDVGYHEDTVNKARVFDVINSQLPLFANLRVTEKSLRYLQDRELWNRDLLWTIWHLELARQLDPKLRATIALLADDLKEIMSGAHWSLRNHLSIKTELRPPRLHYPDKSAHTLFSYYRSCFWDRAKERLFKLPQGDSVTKTQRAEALHSLLLDHRKMDFVTSLCLMPQKDAPAYDALLASGFWPNLEKTLSAHTKEEESAFAWTLANY